MSTEETPSRREFIKAATAAGITGGITSTAGCSSGAETSDDPDSNGTQNNTDDKSTDNTGTQDNVSYNPRIQHGEEFEWFVDPGHLSENKLFANVFGKEEHEELFANIPWQVYRTPDMVEALDQETVDVLDENPRNILGRGFADADLSEMGYEVVIGLGEIGAADILKDPEAIEDELLNNFEQVDQRNGRKIYEGNFVDTRFDGDTFSPYNELEYDVRIGHEIDGNNIIWVGNAVEEEKHPSIFNDIKGVYGVLEGTVGGKIGEDQDYTTVMHDGTDKKVNKAIKAVETSFPEDHFIMKADIEASPEPYNGESFMDVGDFYMVRWDEEAHESFTGKITEEDGEYGTFVKENTTRDDLDPEDGNNNYQTTYALEA